MHADNQKSSWFKNPIALIPVNGRHLWLAIVVFLGIMSLFAGCAKKSDMPVNGILTPTVSIKKADMSVNDILTLVKSEVETIASIEMATEETDTNGMLGKQGCYIECGWFVDSRIDEDESGTDAGGTIEKFRTEEDAKKRNVYLASFDGTMFRAGYHERCGVFVIRISDALTATQQKEIAEKIKNCISK